MEHQSQQQTPEGQEHGAEEGSHLKSADTSGRPEYIPEKFWDGDTGKPLLESMGKSYTELETKIRNKKEELLAEAEQARRESLPEEYAFDPDKIEIPEGVEFKPDAEDPLLSMWKGIAKDAGLSQEQFDAGVKQWIENEIAALPKAEEEIGKLGERGAERVNNVRLYLQSKLPEKHFETLAPLAVTADVVEALETLIATKEPKPSEVGGDDHPVKISEGDLEQMMDDPRYWDPSRQDPAYIRKVQDAYDKFYGKGQVQSQR